MVQYAQQMIKFPCALPCIKRIAAILVYRFATTPWWTHTNSVSGASGCAGASICASRGWLTSWTDSSQPFSPHTSPSHHWSLTCSSSSVSSFASSALNSSNPIVISVALESFERCRVCRRRRLCRHYRLSAGNVSLDEVTPANREFTFAVS